MENTKKGFVVKEFPDFDGLGIHVPTFLEYLTKLPSKNGWVHFAIHRNRPGSVYSKNMTPQYDASPKEVSIYLWESLRPGTRVVPFDQWLKERRENYSVKQDSGEERL